MKHMSLLGFAACAADDEFRANMPFRCDGIDRNTIPAMLRRRSSQAMQLAFSAATEACARAGRSPSALPAVFASVAGEIQTTDQICIELAKADGVVSPSAFHNSVQNTAAGYWSIAHQCTQPASALAAGQDTFAMALLEAWCQLTCQGGELLLVCYDERWPDYLAPGLGQTAFACAMVLAAGTTADSLLRMGRPVQEVTAALPDGLTLAADMPILSAIPLLGLAGQAGSKQPASISVGQAWRVAADSG